ncbi:MAG: processive 1,2-diacylglycerol beta-glucosyltransferase [Blastocatellia bacterium]|jgi:processive 1,2-diacylglycerol beta-glucosyltransferase|nr:processive 1,2-diacylglycerol beta-glucosyltransferase [Blastocatellia bacterium]
MFDKVLVLSASAGAGHVRAAQAVESALNEMQVARAVRHVDTLDYTNKLFRRLYSRAYLDLVNNAPEVLGWLYDQLDKPWKNERRRLALDKLNTRPFVKLLKDYQPEIVVCTHFLPAEIISWLRAKERLRCRQVIVVTDFDVHAMWLCHHYERYFVALDETREHLSKLGIPPSKLSVSGIPIDPIFAQPKDKQEMRRKHNLAADRTTILVSAGGFGVGSIEHLMAPLMELRHPAQIISICGRNEEMKRKVEGLARRLPAGSHVAVKALGYTNEMDELMAASDIVLGKPGGLTTSEALARGLVFVIVNPIPGQEERNSDHLLEEGVAIRCNNLPVLAYKVDRLLDDPARFRSMQANARRLARPRAAYDIVATMLDMQNAV